MEAYYEQQSVSPFFSGHYIQRGSSFGALAAGFYRAALPIARKFLWPVAKTIGLELFVQAVPELVEVITKKVSKTSNKIDRAKNCEKSSWRIIGQKEENQEKTIQSSFTENNFCREVGLFSFLKFKIITNLLPAEAKHTTLDLFEKQLLLLPLTMLLLKKLDHHIPRTVQCLSLKFWAIGTVS